MKKKSFLWFHFFLSFRFGFQSFISHPILKIISALRTWCKTIHSFHNVISTSIQNLNVTFYTTGVRAFSHEIHVSQITFTNDIDKTKWRLKRVVVLCTPHTLFQLFNWTTLFQYGTHRSVEIEHIIEWFKLHLLLLYQYR